MAAPTIRGVGTVAANTAAVTPGYPTGTAAGDLALMFIESANTGVSATATDWTEIVNADLGLGLTTNARLTILYRTVSNPATDNLTTNDTGNHQLARIIGITAGTWNTSNPFNVTNNGTSGNTLSIPGADTTVDDCLILAAQAAAGPDADSTTEYSNEVNVSLTSLTEQIDNTTAQGNGGGLLVISGVKATAGTVSATTADAVSTSNRAYGFLAIEPAPSGTNYDETGRLVTVTSTVASTDNLSFGEALTVTVASTFVATDRADFVQALGSTGTVTITATDSHAASEAVSVAVVATVTASDSIRNVEALALSIASTVTGFDALSFGEAAAVAIASTVAGTDALFLTEALTVTITSTVAATDVLTGAQNYDETGRLVSVTATVIGFDQATSTDALTVTVSSTVTATDILTATDDLAFTIVSTVTGSDILSGAPINYNETGRLVSVVSTVTATDQVDVDENVTVTIASTVTASDLLGFFEATTVTIVSTVTGDDLATLTDNVTVDIVATITVTDRITGPTFWQTDPVGYTANPAAYTKNPAAYVPVGPSDSPPW